MSTIRFIHAADLHLDSPFKGMKGLPHKRLKELRESTFKAFNNFIEHILHAKPDFVLIVGDIYDGEDRSLRAQMKFQEGMKKLNVAGIQVYLSYGNHDHLGGRWTRFELPPNVHVFSGDVETIQTAFNGNAVHITGFSYSERHIRNRMVQQYPAASNSADFNIGMLHGSIEGNETHAVYAPFTKNDLLSKNYDYWALGHIHVRQNLHEDPPIVYSGNLQGRHRNEQGIKGFYEVELSKSSAELKFIPASALVFDTLLISCKGICHANEWIERCVEGIDAFKAQYGSGIVELVMVEIDREASDLFDQSPDDEWLDVLREVVEDDALFVWIHSLSFTEDSSLSSITDGLSKSVLEQINNWTEDEWKIILKDVYQHARGVRYLDVLKEHEIRTIKKGVARIMATETSEK
ncbi:exonuclease SbcCD subunit D [Sporosarcina siberiensis]|uniref:Exonuclease SbcCD subunit D n=1 Tax=Sporosarcina siberiensis TaxID=1365606 RepID=A0ABW4SBY1_9BACL